MIESRITVFIYSGLGSPNATGIQKKCWLCGTVVRQSISAALGAVWNILGHWIHWRIPLGRNRKCTHRHARVHANTCAHACTHAHIHTLVLCVIERSRQRFQKRCCVDDSGQMSRQTDAYCTVCVCRHPYADPRSDPLPARAVRFWQKIKSRLISLKTRFSISICLDW